MDLSWLNANMISTLGIPAVLLIGSCFYILKLLNKIDTIQDERIIESKDYSDKLHDVLDKVNDTMSKLVEKLEKTDGTQ